MSDTARQFPATAAGYASLLSWLGKFGDVALVGMEGTGSYGAGLARYLAKHGIQVLEVDRADRQDRCGLAPGPSACPWPPATPRLTATRDDTRREKKNGPPSRKSAANGPFPLVVAGDVAGDGFELS